MSTSALLLIIYLSLLDLVALVSSKYIHVCNDIDVRNRIENFDVLENCTIIEGNLQIVLIENAAQSQLEAVSFPNLREITGYLLIYRVCFLRSLAQFFPNLAVIRGQTLFHNYAIVIFENQFIEDLGLRSLKRVLRGAIRIEKNTNLCYLDSVDWSLITSPEVSHEHHFISENGDPNQCSNICPTLNDSNGGIIHCSMTKISQDHGHDNVHANRPLCWNQDYCQIVCPANCLSGECYMQSHSAASPSPGVPLWFSHRSTHHEIHCCHPECLGGCTGPSDTDCIACVHVMRDGQCYPKCPPNMLVFRGWRCLTEIECRRGGDRDEHWKVLDGNQCVEDCPPGTIIDPLDAHLCKACEGRCPKVCTGIVVDNIAAAQNLKGCTIIADMLEIQMRGEFAEAELAENLGMIEEVTGYLQVARSHTITSFKFLKNLRRIHGQWLYKGRYSLFVSDNQNLREVWNPHSSVNLTIDRGAAYFHLNPKLCLSNVFQLVAGSKLSDEAGELDISQTTNGDQVACDVNLLSLEIMNKTPWNVDIRWQNDNLADENQLLSWVIYYRKTSNENITVFNAMDVCGSDMWKMIDVKPLPSSLPYVEVTLSRLEPFTKYAVYIQMYTISTARSAAMSPTKYFTTSPSKPSVPRNLVAIAKHPGQLHVSWLEPSLPNGIVTSYFVFWRLLHLSSEKFDPHNFCNEKLPVAPKLKANSTSRPYVRNITAISILCCKCPKSKEQQKRDDEERRFQIEFENFLHDTVYRKKPVNRGNSDKSSADDMNDHRIKRELPDFAQQFIDDQFQNDFVAYSGNFSRNDTEHLTTELDSRGVIEVLGNKELVLENLNHFQEYSIEVIACHDYAEGSESKLCSARAMTSARTLPNGLSDALTGRELQVTNNTQLASSVVIKWMAPESPNGLILLYKIELIRIDVQNYKPDISCVSQRQFIADGGFITQTLAPGNWSLRMHAMSLAGDGPWTEYQYFYVADLEIEDSHEIGIIMGIVCSGIFAVTVIGAMVVWFVRRRFNSMMTEEQLYVLSSNPHYGLAEEAYVPDGWEVSRDKIQLGRELGQGSFGMVYEGIATDIVKGESTAKVAIKTVNSKASIRDRIAFLNEASVMKQFDCHHVIKLLGIVSCGRPTLVVMELMTNGDLKNFLRKNRPDEQNRESVLSFGHLLQMAGEIADGMAYLASMKFVHRDLAARNCMVAEDMTVKIGDFGMARDIYGMDYYKKGTRGLLPVRWMAPECLKDGIFNSPSDVWSYGVVLWEMATWASQPYQGMSNEEVLHYVIGGGILDKPEGCPNRLYDMMLLCWRHNPSHRPTFVDLIEGLAPELPERFRLMSYFYDRNSITEVEEAQQCDQVGVVVESSLGDDDDDETVVPLVINENDGEVLKR